MRGSIFKLYNSVDAAQRIARLSVLKCIKEACITHNDECYEAILYSDENYNVCYVNNAIEVAMREDGNGNYLRTQHGMIKEMLEGTSNPTKLYDDAVTYLYGIDNRAALDTLRL